LHRRTYLVQVNYKVSEEALQKLRTGITFQVKGGKDYLSTPCEVTIVENPPDLFRAGYELPRHLPYTWLLITLTEGKFHQVRKMISGIRHRVQRLIRVSIEDLLLGDLQPGNVIEVEENYLFEKLRIN